MIKQEWERKRERERERERECEREREQQRERERESLPGINRHSKRSTYRNENRQLPCETYYIPVSMPDPQIPRSLFSSQSIPSQVQKGQVILPKIAHHEVSREPIQSEAINEKYWEKQIEKTQRQIEKAKNQRKKVKDEIYGINQEEKQLKSKMLELRKRKREIQNKKRILTQKRQSSENVQEKINLNMQIEGIEDVIIMMIGEQAECKGYIDQNREELYPFLTRQSSLDSEIKSLIQYLNKLKVRIRNSPHQIPLK